MQRTPHWANEPSGKAQTPAGLSPLDLALLQLAGRIAQVIEDEHRILAGAPADEFDHVIARKSHLALEAARFRQHAGGYVPASAARRELEAAAAALAANADLIRRHLDAVGELSSLVAGIYNQATSDGTYTSDAIRQARKR